MHAQQLTRTFTSTTHEHMDGRHGTRTARHHAHATQQSKVQCWSSRREGYGRAPNHGLRPRGWPTRPDAKSAPHADAVSQGGVEVCKGREGAHLLLLDADDVLGAARMQGVWRPSAARLTTCRAHLAASGASCWARAAALGNKGGAWLFWASRAPGHPELRDGRPGWCPAGLSSARGRWRRRRSRLCPHLSWQLRAQSGCASNCDI